MSQTVSPTYISRGVGCNLRIRGTMQRTLGPSFTSRLAHLARGKARTISVACVSPKYFSSNVRQVRPRAEMWFPSDMSRLHLTKLPNSTGCPSFQGLLAVLCHSCGRDSYLSDSWYLWRRDSRSFRPFSHRQPPRRRCSHCSLQLVVRQEPRRQNGFAH